MADNGSSRRPTSADVAREAGLSRSTVSYVLNNDPHQKIPEVTRQRVHDAARRLGYTPSAAARMLRSGRSDLVLCLLPDWPMGPALGALLEHLSAALEAEGLTLVLHPRVHSSRPTSALWRSISPAVVLLLEPVSDEEQTEIRAMGAVVVFALFAEGRSHPRRLFYAEERLGRMQLEHLAVMGHRHVGYAYPDDERVRAFALPRLEGVRMACADLELDPPAVRVVPLNPSLAEDAIRAWRSSTPQVTAVCAYNDEVAMAVLSGAIRLGVAVPDELAVIGVDDIPTAPLTQPPLTTVGRDPAVYAESITLLVTRAVKGLPPPRSFPNSTSVVLVQRESA